MIALGLWLLATLDSAFAGYRAAAGRNALIDKQRYYLRAVIFGAIAGQLAVALAAAIIVISLAPAPDRRGLLGDYNLAGGWMLLVYLPYTAAILFAFGLRLIPSVDIRSITSTLVFGPFTLVRPVVAIAGLVCGVLAAPRLATVVVGLIVLTMMLSLERVLGLFR
ncbi:MAG TPA: hypothetical protein VE961_22500 [Pyrinomonadaceae bacterium]|nr:hypothetical protein [Pyrinomonadaceae bacterium]